MRGDKSEAWHATKLFCWVNRQGPKPPDDTVCNVFSFVEDSLLESLLLYKPWCAKSVWWHLWKQLQLFSNSSMGCICLWHLGALPFRINIFSIQWYYQVLFVFMQMLLTLFRLGRRMSPQTDVSSWDDTRNVRTSVHVKKEFQVHWSLCIYCLNCENQLTWFNGDKIFFLKKFIRQLILWSYDIVCRFR